MRTLKVIFFILFTVSFITCDSDNTGGGNEDANILAAWTVLGPSGGIIARVITDGSPCPGLRIVLNESAGTRGGEEITQTMEVRADAGLDSNFPVTVCESPIPPDAGLAAINGVELPLPVNNPRKIAIIGDTGCRLDAKDDKFQACNDPEEWPFKRIADSAAEWNPDLVVHVGDYLYRESKCPEGNAGCDGSPHGDKWDAWNADFFTPAMSLLRKAPLIMARGNHEQCGRGGKGWFIMLDTTLPAPPASDLCQNFSEPFSVDIGGFDIFNMDTANADDTDAPSSLVDEYASQFAALSEVPAESAWLLTHHPMWGIDDEKKPPTDPKCCTNLTLQEARKMSFPESVELVLSGHVHLFQYLNFNGDAADESIPSQLITGSSGVELNSSPTASIDGMSVAGMTIEEGMTIDEHGFSTIELKEDGSIEIALRDRNGSKIVSCSLMDENINCE